MDQIIKYNDIKSVNDIVKKFVYIPMHAIQDDNGVKFTIANYNEFKQVVINLAQEYNKQFIITEDNVSVFEKDAASIKKLADKTKKDAKAFINQFGDTLTAQAKEINDICMKAYDNLHAQTVAFRNLKKINQETAIIAEIKETPIGETTLISVVVPNGKINAFKEYCKDNDIIIKE